MFKLKEPDNDAAGGTLSEQKTHMPQVAVCCSVLGAQEASEKTGLTCLECIFT